MIIRCVLGIGSNQQALHRHHKTYSPTPVCQTNSPLPVFDYFLWCRSCLNSVKSHRPSIQRKYLVSSNMETPSANVVEQTKTLSI